MTSRFITFILGMTLMYACTTQNWLVIVGVSLLAGWWIVWPVEEL